MAHVAGAAAGLPPARGGCQNPGVNRDDPGGPQGMVRVLRVRAGLTQEQLPPAVPGFTGRARELNALTHLPGPAGTALGPVVISAIAGTAGVGKTALALHWAHGAAGRFPDGQLYVNLRGYDPDRPVAAASALTWFLRALGVPGPDVPPEPDERAALYRSLLAPWTGAGLVPAARRPVRRGADAEQPRDHRAVPGPLPPGHRSPRPRRGAEPRGGRASGHRIRPAEPRPGGLGAPEAEEVRARLTAQPESP